VRDIARWRAHHDLADTTPAIGRSPGEPDAAAAWNALQGRLARTRVWLAASDRIHPTNTVVPSYGELLERRAELDALFATAPGDWRHTIARVRTGQLTLDDTADVIQAALDGQQARRDWILANWPHVVEYQEISRTLTTGAWGPDPKLLTNLLTEPLNDTLAAAIHAGEPWLRAALIAVADRNTTSLDVETTERLEAFATVRAERGTSPSSLFESSELVRPDAESELNAGIEF
jgi:hypothetical protein